MKSVAIFYKHFFPGFRAGGPIQSLVNLIDLLKDDYRFYVVTSAFDLGDSVPYSSVELDQWNTVKLPTGANVEVWYTSSHEIKTSALSVIFRGVTIDVVFVNGLFTSFATVPLNFKDRRVIVSPRGMFQSGALQNKSWQKRLFIFMLKTRGLFKGIEWHATNVEEQEDIRKYTYVNAEVTVIENIPKPPAKVEPIDKRPSVLRLVYLSLISEKKNLSGVLKALTEVKSDVTFDIYGPVKDERYWQGCQNLIESMPKNIRVAYRGVVEPQDVQATISRYHALISLTKGENFGHALFECLGVGRPLITSFFTPWNHLMERHAGWNLDIDDQQKISERLNNIAELSQSEFDKYCDGAWRMANDFIEKGDLRNRYKKLFG